VVFEAYSPALASLSYDNEAARKPQAGIVSVVMHKRKKKEKEKKKTEQRNTQNLECKSLT